MDRIENASLYYRLGDRIEAALRALQTNELAHAEIGRRELQGSDLFALVQEYETRPRELEKWEAHRRYVDVQYIVSGVEVMGYAHISDLTMTAPYSEKEDAASLAGGGNFLTVSAGMFVIFFPQDAHMPCLAAAAPGPVRKIVLKVRVG